MSAVSWRKIERTGAVLAEVERAFAAYEQALMDNDLDTLDALFWHSPLTVRIGPGRTSTASTRSRRFARIAPAARRSANC
jgi:hypothetical protein